MSFRTLRCSLFHEPVFWLELFLPLLTVRRLYYNYLRGCFVKKKDEDHVRLIQSLVEICLCLHFHIFVHKALWVILEVVGLKYLVGIYDRQVMVVFCRTRKNVKNVFNDCPISLACLGTIAKVLMTKSYDVCLG